MFNLLYPENVKRRDSAHADTAPRRGGIHPWRQLIRRLRELVLLTTPRFPQSPVVQVVNLLDLPVDLVRLNGA